jgi:hypothetical protein
MDGPLNRPQPVKERDKGLDEVRFLLDGPKPAELGHPDWFLITLTDCIPQLDFLV